MELLDSNGLYVDDATQYAKGYEINGNFSHMLFSDIRAVAMLSFK